MARDPNITVTERLVKAARRWAALRDAEPTASNFDETIKRVGDLEDAVRAYEKHHGMRPIPFAVPVALRVPRKKGRRKPR